tara:strand:- start:167 stop:1165 length:999 start_codon:yes stop_codon:yes gene_type:complete
MYIRKRKNNWQCTVKRRGFKRQIESFKTQAAAKAWGRRVETMMDDGSWIDTSESRSTAIDAIVDKYIESYQLFGMELPQPKLSQLNIIKAYFGNESLHNLTLERILHFAADRRKKVSASTLQAQIYYLKQAIENSRIKTVENVVDQAMKELTRRKIIMGSKRRERRLEPGEYESLMKASEGNWLGAAIDIAIESGMRQGEIHALKKSDMNFETKVITLWRKDIKAETGKSLRKIPLLKGVREALLRHSNVLGQGDSLFYVKHAASISDRFARVTNKLGIKDLRFHDLRHEAISRFFEKGMRLEKVRVISGHRTLDQLSRYVNLRAEDISNSE